MKTIYNFVPRYDGRIMLLLCAMLFILWSCTQQQAALEDTGYSVNMIEMDWPERNADDIYFRFNILDNKKDDKVVWSDLKAEHVQFVSEGEDMTVKDLSILTNQAGMIPNNVLVLLLVDKSIQSSDMQHVRDAANSIVTALPENTAYISFFDEQLRASKKITPANFDDFQSEFTLTKNNKLLFDAALKKFQELSGEKGMTADPQLIEKIENNDVIKYLVILTDGRVDVNNIMTADNIQKFSEYVQSLDGNAANKKHIEIHAIRYGNQVEDVDQTLSYLCVDLRNKNVEGGLYIADPEAFIEKLKVSDKYQPDYELTIANAAIGFGAKKEALIRLDADGKKATGHVSYAVGSLLRPVHDASLVKRLLFGLLFWGILFGLAVVIIQIIIPYFRANAANFEKKHVRNFSFENDTIMQCHYCLDEICDGEEIVTKCKHTVHKHCWIENGGKCADFGENCKEGIQYYFDSDHVFSKAHRPFYASFAWWGLTCGFLAWLVYQLITWFFPYPFQSFTDLMISKYYAGYPENPILFLRYVFLWKIESFMMAGLIMGFIPLFILSYLNKYRHPRKFNFGWVLLKSILGVIAGFISFLAGAILVVSCKTAETNVLIDSVTWILSGIGWGLCLSIRSHVVRLHLITGGIIAGLLGYLILFLGKWFGSYAVLYGFSILSAAMGIAILASRRTLHRYFLKYQGNASGKIAIHKWMSVAGGSREVTIGKSEDCTIRMDWDSHTSIRDVNVRLYIDRKDKTPCLKVEYEHLLYNRAIAQKNDVYVLKHGTKFKIGNTEFQYIEKEG